jgi:hypothetical protein
MLRHTSFRTRKGEQGQVLVLALAFIAVFAVITAALFRAGDVAGLQYVHTESTALTETTAEGGAAYAAADAARTNPVLTCAPGEVGKLTMQGGHSVQYTVNTCNPGNSASGSPGGGTGLNCLLCILNQTPSVTPSTVVLTANQRLTTTNGNVYVNGSIGSSTTLTANPAGSAHIRLLSGASLNGCVCTPTPEYYAPAITDPLASYGAPAPVAGQPSGCTAAGGTWNPTTGCSLSLSASGSYTVHPGLWASLALSGQANVIFSAGTYVFTGAFQSSGQGNIDATSGVTLYLACPNYGPGGNPCLNLPPVNRVGGYIDISGQGNVSINGANSGQYMVPGQTYGISLLSDPNLLDPAGVAKCRTGNTTAACLLNVSGNGASISGTQDLRSGGINLQGNGGETIATGRLVTNSLYISVSGHAGAGLSLTGPAGSITTSSCGVFDDAVTGSAGGGSPGRAIVQSLCGGSSNTSGIVDFNYAP